MIKEDGSSLYIEKWCQVCGPHKFKKDDLISVGYDDVICKKCYDELYLNRKKCSSCGEDKFIVIREEYLGWGECCNCKTIVYIYAM